MQVVEFMIEGGEFGIWAGEFGFANNRKLPLAPSIVTFGVMWFEFGIQVFGFELNDSELRGPGLGDSDRGCKAKGLGLRYD